MLKRSRTRFIQRMPVRSLFFFSYVLVIFLITSIAGVTFYYLSNEMTVDQINQNAYKMANEMNEQTDSIMTSAVDLGLYLRNDPDLKINARGFADKDALGQLDAESNIRAIISSYLRDKPDIFNVSIVLAGQKTQSIGKNGVYPLEEVQDTDWFKKIEGVDSILLEPQLLTRARLGINVTKPTGPLYMITAMYRVKERGSDIGYLLVDVNTMNLFDNINRDRATANTQVFLVNNNGIVVTSDGNVGINQPLEVNIDPLLQRGSGSYQRIRYHGVDSLLICSMPNSQGWRMVEFIPVRELYLGLERLQLIPLLIILASLLLAMPLSIWLSGYITRPIIHLASHMSRFQTYAGQRAATDFTNEIGTLYSSYNTMMQRLEQSLQDIETANMQRRKSDLKMLQAQINPHFLYNSLDAISWSALENGVPEISEEVSMLSKFYRLNLNNGEAVCTVGDEIDQARYFMQIERLCFNNTFEFICELQPEATDLFMPKMILQPLIENAVKHGFGRKRENGLIILRGRLQEDKLLLEVQDNGRGMDADTRAGLLQSDQQALGIGVKNVNDRIAFLCGEPYGLSFEDAPGGGTLVRATLPICRTATELSA